MSELFVRISLLTDAGTIYSYISTFDSRYEDERDAYARLQEGEFEETDQAVVGLMESLWQCEPGPPPALQSDESIVSIHVKKVENREVNFPFLGG